MPNKIYVAPETTLTWTDTGGDELLNLSSLAPAGVAMGSFADLGAASRSEWYELEVFIDGFDTAPVVGETVDIYISQSNGTTGFDGSPSTDPTTSAQGTMTVNQLKNCLYVGSLSVYSTTAADNLRGRFIVRLPARYVSLLVHNNTVDALLGTLDAHTLKLTPIPPEVQ